jgi:hypothetical protein
MLVEAKDMCFIGGHRRRPGTRFELALPEGEDLPKCLFIVGGDKREDRQTKREEGPTRKELMLQLEAAGVKYGTNDNKDALQALLNEATKAAAPGASGASDKSQPKE